MFGFGRSFESGASKQKKIGAPNSAKLGNDSVDMSPLPLKRGEQKEKEFEGYTTMDGNFINPINREQLFKEWDRGSTPEGERAWREHFGKEKTSFSSQKPERTGSLAEQLQIPSREEVAVIVDECLKKPSPEERLSALKSVDTRLFGIAQRLLGTLDSVSEPERLRSGGVQEQYDACLYALGRISREIHSLEKEIKEQKHSNAVLRKIDEVESGLLYQEQEEQLRIIQDNLSSDNKEERRDALRIFHDLRKAKGRTRDEK